VKQAILPSLLISLILIVGCSSGTAIVDGSSSGTGRKAYGKVITKEAVTDSGLFAVHRVGEDLFFEIPDSLVDRDLLLVSRIAQAPANLGAFIVGGSKVGEQVVRWQRIGDRMLLRKRSYASVAADSLPIARSVEVSAFEPILMAFGVETTHPETGSLVVKVNDLFETDVPAISGLSQARRTRFKVSGLDRDRTFVDSVSSFPLNVNVRHTLTYAAKEPPSDSNAGTISMQMFQSMVLLPTVTMRPRTADPRVGYLTVQQVDYGSDELAADTRRYIQRWPLVPTDPEAYARGEIVEPVKSITFYVDPATPERWRPFVRAGIEDWQAAFESAGFRNAIVARDPSSIADFDAEDVRFSTVRYAASTTRNALGPRVVDPRSGEIIESDIIWFHNHLRSYRNRLMVETGAANPGARSLTQPDELIGETLRQVIAHEVGHALGFPHNMTASSSFPVDSLRSPTFTSRYGVAPSIMDYARQNYVAQPGDRVTRFVRKIGPYDHYAVEWGYRLFSGLDSEAEEALLNEWIRARAGDPMYRFAPSQGSDPVDPRTQTEDIGDDPVAAGTYAVANLKRVVARLISWTARPGRGYDDLAELYSELLSAWSRYMRHVQAVVGGVYMTAKTADQPGPVFEAVPRAKQQAAVRFLIENVFLTPTWLQDRQILSRIDDDGTVTRISQLQVSLLNSLLAEGRLGRLAEAEILDSQRAYPLDALMVEIRRGVWSELEERRPSIDGYRRRLQRAYIERLGVFVRAGSENEKDADKADDTLLSRSDIPAVARAQLVAIEREVERAAGRADDDMTRLHLDDVRVRLAELLSRD
jgi:hypothetical protein